MNNNLQISERDQSIDTIRGLAIVLMIMGNLEPVLQNPHPLWLRIYGSFAAPLFIITAGMMVCLTIIKKNHNFNYYLFRGILLLLIGALIDVLVWGLIPFLTIDVLYLIGLAIPCCYLINRFKISQIIGVIISIIILTLVLQNILGYSAYPDAETYFSDWQKFNVENISLVLKHWLIDGWFPIFPWLAFAFFGVVIGKLRLAKFSDKKQYFYGLGLMAIGLPLWIIYPGALYEREGYSELFYPPVMGFIIFSFGLFLTLLFFFKHYKNNHLFSPLIIVGQSSLFFYIYHSCILGWFVFNIWENLSLIPTLIIYLCLLIIVQLTAYLIKFIKGKYQPNYFWFRFIFGS